MKQNRQSSVFAIVIVLALLIGAALVYLDRPVQAVTLSQRKFPSMCFDPLLTSTVILDPSMCQAPTVVEEQTKAELRYEQSNPVPPVVNEDVPPVVDDGGETMPDNTNPAPAPKNNCTHPNTNRNGHKDCSKNPDTHSGQQHTTNHSDVSAEHKHKKDK